MKNLLLATTIIMLSLNAHAAGWREKPVRCGSLLSVDAILKRNGEDYLLSGAGYAFDDQLKQFDVQVGLWANLERGTWSIIETDGNEACVIAYGDNLSFDLLDKGKPNT
mgnify:CR=1 FL=1|tara:strand:+ start:2345 stop:2671 length:327 start_codon:yes stop_codon:yes gene_type:complete